jgi:hypothetical protein
MSGFIVHPEHIHVLLWTAHSRYCGGPNRLSWVFSNPARANHLHAGNLDEIGTMLIEANAASVNHLYAESTTAPAYRFQQPRHRSWSIPQLLNAIHGYEYQCIDHPGWEHTEAHAFLRELERNLITDLPGYHDGPWTITAQSAPHRRRATR